MTNDNERDERQAQVGELLRVRSLQADLDEQKNRRQQMMTVYHSPRWRLRDLAVLMGATAPFFVLTWVVLGLWNALILPAMTLMTWVRKGLTKGRVE